MADTSENDDVVVTDSDQFFAELIAPGAMFLLALSIWTVIRMIWKGVDERRIWILSVSMASILIFIVVPQMIKAQVIPRIIKGVAALLIFLPFALGCYLFFFEGLGRLRFLENGFSFGLIVAALVYIVGGFGVVKASYNVSEFGRSIMANSIRFD